MQLLKSFFLSKVEKDILLFYSKEQKNIEKETAKEIQNYASYIRGNISCSSNPFPLTVEFI